MEAFCEVFNFNLDRGEFFENMRIYLCQEASKLSDDAESLIKILNKKKFAFKSISLLLDALLDVTDISYKKITDILDVYKVTNDEND